MTGDKNYLAETVFMPGGLFNTQTLIQYWDTFADYIVEFLHYRENHTGNPIRLSTNKVVVHPDDYTLLSAFRTIHETERICWRVEYWQRPSESEYNQMEQSLIIVMKNDEPWTMFALSWFNLAFETHPIGLILGILHYRFFKQKNMEENFRKIIPDSAKDWIDDLVSYLDGSNVSDSTYGIAESQTSYGINLYKQKQVIIRYDLDDLTEKTPALQVLFTFTVQNQTIQMCDINIAPRPDYKVQLPFIFTNKKRIHSILERHHQKWFRESVIPAEGISSDIEQIMEPPYFVSGAWRDKTLVAQADIGQAGRDVGLETLIAIWPKTSMKIAKALGLDGEFLTCSEYPEQRVICCRLISKDGDDCEYVYYRGLHGGHYVFVLINNIPVRADKPTPKTHVPIVDGERKIVDALWEFSNIVRANRVETKLRNERDRLVLRQMMRLHPGYSQATENARAQAIVKELMKSTRDIVEGSTRVVGCYPMEWPVTPTSRKIKVTYNTFNSGKPVESMVALGLDISEEKLKDAVDAVNDGFRRYRDSLTLDETLKLDTLEIAK